MPAATAAMRDLEALIGAIASTPLDRRVPLWELHFCEGLADGRVAVVGKMHHALADGAAANALLANVTDVTLRRAAAELVADAYARASRLPAGAARAPALRDAAIADRCPARAARAHGGAAVAAVRPLPAPAPAAGAEPVLRRAARLLQRLADPAPQLRHGRRCRSPTSSAVRARSTTASTLNDVVLAVVVRGAAPLAGRPRRAPLSARCVAGVPVGADASAASPAARRQPRLQHVHHAGHRRRRPGRAAAPDLADHAPRPSRSSSSSARRSSPTGRSSPRRAPFAACVRAYSPASAPRRGTRAASRRSSPTCPGRGSRLTVGGARLADLFSVGPLVDGIGLNVTVWSYVDRMNFSLLACPDLLPDVEVLASYFPAGAGRAGPRERTTEPRRAHRTVAGRDRRSA